MSPAHDAHGAVSRVSLDMVSAGDVRRLHEASLAFLEEIGIAVPSALARAALLAAGATVGDERGSVKLPATLVEELVALAPQTFALAGHATEARCDDRRWALPAGRGRRRRVRTPPTACARGDRRRPERSLHGRRLSWRGRRGRGAAVAGRRSRCERRTGDLLERDEQARCLTALASAAEAAAVVAAAAAAAGSAAALRERPLVSLLAGPSALDAAIVFARAGLPVGALAGLPAGGAADAAGGDTGDTRRPGRRPHAGARRRPGRVRGHSGGGSRSARLLRRRAAASRVAF